VWSADGALPEDQRGSSGATVVALVVRAHDGKAAWLHLGDSRLYRLRGERLELLTADHTVAGFTYRGSAQIPLELPHSNRLLEALGLEPEVELDLRCGDVVAGDVFLLCSDGISSSVSPEEIRNELGRSGSAAARAAALLARALAAPTQDNASLVVVCVSEG